MAAPNPALRYTVFVQEQGTDDAGYNEVGAPKSRNTIAAALADLAANYPPADSITVFHIVAVGPGAYVLDTLPPPGTVINGSCDGENQPTTILLVEDNLTLPTAWNANATAIGGIANCTLRVSGGTPTLDMTMPVPAAGNPSRTFSLYNVKHNLPTEIFEATSTADVLIRQGIVQNGIAADTFTQIGGSSQFAGVVSAAAITIRDKTSFAAAGVWQGVVTGAGAGLTVESVAAAGCTLRITASNPRTLTISETAPGVVAVQADAVSVPVRASVSYTGTATSADLTLLSDAAGEAYSPTTPADWSAPVPTTVQEALDRLGSGGGSVVGTFAYIVRTGNRSSAAWGVNGCAINDTINTFTDTTSAGAVAGVTAARSFGVPTFASAGGVVYADAVNVYIAGAPIITGGTATRTWALYVNSGASFFSGGLTANSTVNSYGGDYQFESGFNNANYWRFGRNGTSGSFVFFPSNAPTVSVTFATGSSFMSLVLTGSTTAQGGTFEFYGGATRFANIAAQQDTTGNQGQLIFRVNPGSSATATSNALVLSYLGNATFLGNLTTAAPTGGAGAWRLGVYTAGAAIQGGTVRISIGGVDRDLLAV